MATERLGGLAITTIVLIFVSASVFGTSRRQVDVDQHIAGLLSEKAGYSWVETGKIDLDGDGVRDLLLNAHRKKEPHSSNWYVYLRDGDHLYFPLPGPQVLLFRNNTEYRRIQASGDQKVLVTYMSKPERENYIEAKWYARVDDGSYEYNHKRITEDALLPPEDDEVVQSSAHQDWSKRGLDIRNILNDYTRYEADTYHKDAKAVLPGADLGERFDIDGWIKKRLRLHGGPEWIETGQLDLDGDGDLDYLFHAYHGRDERASRWRPLVNRDGEYFAYAPAKIFPIMRKNLEFRRVEGYDGRKVIVWHETRGGKEGIIRPYALGRHDDGSYYVSIAPHSEDFLLPPRDDEIVSAASDGSGKARGLAIEKVMPNYARHFAAEDGEILSLYRIDANRLAGPGDREGEAGKDAKAGSAASRIPWEVIGFVGALGIVLAGLAWTQSKRARRPR